MARGQSDNTSTVEIKRLKSILNLIRIDAERLYIRIKERRNEYLRIFSAERTRSQFHEIFRFRFYEIPSHDLLQISEETYTSIEDFFNTIENLSWYLNHTQELPGTVAETVDRYISSIDNKYVLLQSYLKAEYSTYEDNFENS